MGFLDKVKNMFIEEVEEDEPIKKEVIQVKIPTPVEEHEEEKELEQEVEVEPKKEEKKPLPTFFDDSDFADLEVEKKDEEPKMDTSETGYVRKEPVPIVKPTITGYNGRREETKKVFTPTPIISPVYGVLDKNYKKDEITSKKKNSTVTTLHSELNPVNIDDIRNKAFGTLEDEIDTNLISKEDLMFTSKKVEKPKVEEKIQAPIDIFAELENDSIEEEPVLELDNDNYDAFDRLFNSYDFSKTPEPKVEDTLNKDYDELEKDINVEEKYNSSNLFNLIDEMYEKKDGE